MVPTNQPNCLYYVPFAVDQGETGTLVASHGTTKTKGLKEDMESSFKPLVTIATKLTDFLKLDSYLDYQHCQNPSLKRWGLFNFSYSSFVHGCVLVELQVHSFHSKEL